MRECYTIAKTFAEYFKTPDNMGNIDDFRIEHGSNSFSDRLFIVPLSYEQNKLDDNRPLASGAIGDLTSKIVPCDQQLVSKPKTRMWRKISRIHG